MQKYTKLEHRFVAFIPEQLESGILYISLDYPTVVHLCACGCGKEVVTPLTPSDWSLIFDGNTISLKPSIGNWSFPCRSHYWIYNNKVLWAEDWDENEVWNNRNGKKHKRKISFGPNRWWKLLISIKTKYDREGE